MSLSTAIQATLISAGTAALVTLLIEYAAKPRLEVRKDTLLEANRAKRTLAVRLMNLTRESGDIVGIVIGGPLGWKAAQSCLDAIAEPVGKLIADLEDARYSLSKSRFRLTTDFLSLVHVDVTALATTVAALNNSEDEIRRDLDDSSEFKNYVELVCYRIVSNIGLAYTALVLDRQPPWHYWSKLRALKREVQKRDAAMPDGREVCSGQQETRT
jgi:hypothetical protein